jgi:serine/threonine protein kinase
MHCAHARPDPQDHRLDELIAEYLRAKSEGTGPSRDTFLATHPELADDLRLFFQNQDELDQLMRPLHEILPIDSALAPGETIGDYELLEEIGRGGMSIVYKARHKSVPRIVALKMLRAGSEADATQLRRFRSEAEAVAILDHPHIVPIYEVGEHQKQPYYCMKLVEGGTLADHLDKWRATPCQAAEVLAPVAAAIHFAHQRGILHRDLKPSNVLLARGGYLRSENGAPSERAPVTGDSRALAEWTPLVADFGLAKHVQVDSAVTQTGAILGTPSYMAPEQASGQKGLVTTTADVYGLGAILYECLTGQPPFRGDTVMETLLLVREKEPERPRLLNPRVDADLETICLKCLEKEPARRYASAEAVADDLRRYLVGLPIHARPIRGVERLARFCRRKPTLAGLWLVLVLGLALTSWQWWRAEYHRGEATERLQKIEAQAIELRKSLEDVQKQKTLTEQYYTDAHQAVTQFYTHFSNRPELRSVPNLEPLRKDLMAEALRYFERFLKQRGNDPALKAELAETHLRVGDLLRDTDAKMRALESYRQALVLRQALADAEPSNRMRQSLLADVYIKLSLVHKQLGQYPAAEETQQQAVVLRETIAAQQPGSVEAQILLVSGLNNLAVIYRETLRPTESLQVLERALTLLDRLRREAPKDQRALYHLSTVWGNIGILHHDGERPDQAREAYEKALQASKERLKHTKTTAQDQVDMGHFYLSLAHLHRNYQKPAEAASALEKALGLIKLAADDNPLMTSFQEELATTYKEMAHVKHLTDQRKEALALMDQARQIQEKVGKLYPAATPLHRSLADTWFHTGYFLAEAGNHDQAIRAYRECCSVSKKLIEVHPEEAWYHNQLGVALLNLSALYRKRGLIDDALQCQITGLEHEHIAWGKQPKHATYRRVLSKLCHVHADLLRQLGRIREALPLQQERVKLWPNNGAELAGIAAEIAQCAADVAKDKAEPSADDEKLRRQCADLAMDVLKKALASGYRDVAKLEKETAFDILRQRDDFKAALAEATVNQKQ